MRWIVLGFCLAAAGSSAWAQPTPRSDRGGGEQAVSADLIRLHDDLQLSDGQEPAWHDYTVAIAPNPDTQARHQATTELLPMVPTPRRIALIEDNEDGREMMAIESLAGRARVARATGDARQALAHVDTVLGYLDGGGTVDGTEDPLQIYLTCYHALADEGIPRASEILATGRALLMQQLETLDPSERAGLLERVPSHRGLLAAFDATASEICDEVAQF